MQKSFQRTLAILGLTAMTACSSGGGSTPSLPNPTLGNTGGITQQNFAGIGDSLTFGEQAGGMLGARAANPVSALANNAVPPTQTNGFWALMYAQMNGITLDPAMGNLDTALGAGASPLPLINAPGLGDQLVVSAVSPPFTGTQSSCDSFNQAAYSPTAWTTTRVSPNAPIANLGIPGITMHEAVSMTGPLTGPPTGPNCGYVTLPGDPTSGGLQSLVQDESELYYPVLGQFQNSLGAGHVTQLSAALALKPQLTTVWLGANDLLKFIFSHGQSPITDTPQQLATDLTTIVTSLEKSGSKVVVGNLPDILGNPSAGEAPVPQFFPASKLTADLTTMIAAALIGQGVPQATAVAEAAQLASANSAYVQSTYTGANGFLTESGFFSLVSQIAANPTGTPNLDPTGKGSGDGPLYLDQTFAAQAIALNAGYNQAINGVAAATGAALADIQTQFQQMSAAGTITVGGTPVSLQFGGGILSFDGLHPSNIGYALIANTFIGAADTKFSMSIPLIDGGNFASGPAFIVIAHSDPYSPNVIKAKNPLWPFPLP